MRILIIGGGEIGYALCVALSSEHDVFVVDNDAQVAERFAHVDCEFVEGSGTSPEVLRLAQVDGCDLFIACTQLDEVNIVACSIGNQLGAGETVCFVSKQDFVRPPGGTESLREHFGIDRVIWPEAQLAAAIERIIMAPGAIDAGVFADGKVRLLEFKLQPDSSFVGKSVAEAGLPSGVVAVAVKRGEAVTIPRGGTRFEAGDKVALMGAGEAMETLRPRLSPDGTQTTSQVVTIIGGGDVGYRLAQRLDAASNIELRVIERDQGRGELLAASLRRGLVLQGDGTDLELLESEEIGRSDVMVSVIDNDERNLLACLVGRQLGVRKVITRVSKPPNLRLFELVGIDVALSARGAAVASVVHQIDGGRSNLLAVLEQGQARVIELVVPPDHPEAALMDLNTPADSIVAAILRGDDVIVPSGTDRILRGDRLLVCCTQAASRSVRDTLLPVSSS